MIKVHTDIWSDNNSCYLYLITNLYRVSVKWELDGLTSYYIPIKPILTPSYRFIMKLFLLFLLWQVELIRLVEYLADLIDFQQCSASRIAQSEATAKVSYLVVESDVSLLTKHTQGCYKHIFSRGLFLLMDRNYAIAKIEQRWVFSL